MTDSASPQFLEEICSDAPLGHYPGSVKPPSSRPQPSLGRKSLIYQVSGPSHFLPSHLPIISAIGLTIEPKRLRRGQGTSNGDLREANHAGQSGAKNFGSRLSAGARQAEKINEKCPLPPGGMPMDSNSFAISTPIAKLAPKMLFLRAKRAPLNALKAAIIYLQNQTYGKIMGVIGERSRIGQNCVRPLPPRSPRVP